MNNVMEKKIMLRNYKFYMERVDFVKDYYEFPKEFHSCGEFAMHFENFNALLGAVLHEGVLNQLLADRYMENEYLLFEDDLYVVTTPSSLSDICDEAHLQDIAVYRYARKMAYGYTQFIFARIKDNAGQIDLGNLTMEISMNYIIQALGYSERTLSGAEREWVKGYAEKRGLKISPRLEGFNVIDDDFNDGDMAFDVFDDDFLDVILRNEVADCQL